MLNRITIIGVVSRKLPAQSRCSASLQITTKAASSQFVEVPELIGIECQVPKQTSSPQLAEFVANSLHEGDKVYLEGALQLEDQNSKGSQTTKWVVVIHDVQKLASAKPFWKSV